MKLSSNVEYNAKQISLTIKGSVYFVGSKFSGISHDGGGRFFGKQRSRRSLPSLRRRLLLLSRGLVLSLVCTRRCVGMGDIPDDIANVMVDDDDDEDHAGDPTAPSSAATA